MSGDDRPPGPTVFVSGWAGSTNLGDELLGLALVRKLQARGMRPIVASIDPELTRRRFGVDSIHHTAWLKVRRAIARSDGLLFGGGAIVQDLTSQANLPYHLARPRIASAVGTAWSSIGVGAGPLRSRFARTIARRVLERAVTVGVRDQDSVNLVRSLGVERVRLGADLALSLPDPQVEMTDRLVVSLRPPITGGFLPVASRTHSVSDEWADAAATALDATATRTGLTIHFVPLQTDRDAAIHHTVAERMTADTTHASPDLDTIIDELASGRAAVAMRYHGAIGAAMGHLPTVVLGYAPKSHAIADEMGPGFTSIGSDVADLAALPELVERVVGRRDDVAEAHRVLKDRERRNDGIIDELMTAHV